MPGRKRDFNPTAFIGVGVCFMGSGVALSLALLEQGTGAVGISLIGLGAVFLILGVNKKRELKSRSEGGEDHSGPPA